MEVLRKLAADKNTKTSFATVKNGLLFTTEFSSHRYLGFMRHSLAVNYSMQVPVHGVEKTESWIN